MKAWRTRTSLNGFWSMRMVIGCQAPLLESSTRSPEFALITGAWALGRSEIASTVPPSRAFTRAVASVNSMMVSSSTQGTWP